MSVSNAGRQRGRGRGTKGLQKNLNRGQIIGVGKVNMLWPGLTGPIMRGSMVVKQQKLPEDKDREAKLIKMREEWGFRRSRKVHTLERGWTSARVAGRNIGPPDPVNDGELLYFLLCFMSLFILKISFFITIYMLRSSKLKFH